MPAVLSETKRRREQNPARLRYAVTLLQGGQVWTRPKGPVSRVQQNRAINHGSGCSVWRYQWKK